MTVGMKEVLYNLCHELVRRSADESIASLGSKGLRYTQGHLIDVSRSTRPHGRFILI